MPAYPFRSGRAFARALNPIVVITLIALVTGLSSAAFAASPTPVEGTKSGVTINFGPVSGLDPWKPIENTLQQFMNAMNANFILRLFLSLALAAGCAWLIAWYPQRSPRYDRLSKLEERKALVLLGLVGAIVAKVSQVNALLALIILGIGALLRFRTELATPKLTGKAIIVVVVGLACGLDSWAMALLVTAFSWLLIRWLDSHWSCRITIQLKDDVASQPISDLVESLLASKHCRLKNSAFYEDIRKLVFLIHVPSQVDPRKLAAELRTQVKKSEVKIEVG